jgi:hypothetical protein
MAHHPLILKFNVGGTRYEVSHSLLQSFPDSMLAKIAATEWHTDPNAEIFIERDGVQFRYVLEYLRDGRVHLPESVPKASLLLDLDFFGVPVNGNNIMANPADYSDEISRANRLQARANRLQADLELTENEIEAAFNKMTEYFKRNPIG